MFNMFDWIRRRSAPFMPEMKFKNLEFWLNLGQLSDPQFSVHLNANFRFGKETPLRLKVSRGKIVCYLPDLFIAIS